MKNSIKITTLATWTLTAALGAWGGMQYQSLRNQADMGTLQEVGFVNKAKSQPIAHFIDQAGMY